MLTSGVSHARAFGAPTTYKRIVPARGCGFILRRIYDMTADPFMPCPTRQDVYLGTKGYHRDGFGSVLWAALLADGLIESTDGMQRTTVPYTFWNSRHWEGRKGKSALRAGGHMENGKWTVRYRLTPKGCEVLFKMLARTQPGQKLSGIGTGDKHDAGKDLVEAVNEAPKTESRSTVPENVYGNADSAVSPAKSGGDVLRKEAVDCAKLAASLAGELQKLRAEKENRRKQISEIVNSLRWMRDALAAVEKKVAGLAD